MNTSDQSLFPIDSAFKRRWNWKYVPIEYNKKDWTFLVGDNRYSWGEFLKKMNPIISGLTESPDKQMGYFFAKADVKSDSALTENDTITEDVFLNKVLFYLWTDVLKDFDAGKEPFINPDTKKAYEFSDFFDNEHEYLSQFVDKLGLEVVSTVEPLTAADEEKESRRAPYKTLTVTFPDGTVIKEDTIVGTYLKTLETIGIERAAKVAETLKYNRRGFSLITTEKIQELIDNGYSYAQIGDYYVLKGFKNKTFRALLKQISEVYSLDLTVTLE
jgi:hypothetical protein